MYSSKYNDPNCKPMQKLDKIVWEDETHYALQWHGETIITFAKKDKFLSMAPNAKIYIKRWEERMISIDKKKV